MADMSQYEVIQREKDMNTTIRNRHDRMVARLIKPAADIMAEMTEAKVDILHMAVGIAGEAGELLDAAKKHFFYGMDLDEENALEELGDLAFYIAGMRQRLGLGVSDPLRYNLEKLERRYPDGYTNEAAEARADKADES